MMSRRQKTILIICLVVFAIYCFGFAGYMIWSILMQRPVPEIYQPIFSPIYYTVEIVLGADCLVAAYCLKDAPKLRAVLIFLVIIGMVNLAVGTLQFVFRPFEHVFEGWSHV